MVKFRRYRHKARALPFAVDPSADRQPFGVDPSGDWRACTDTIPKDCRVIGTVTSAGTTGALVRLNKTGAYVKVSNGEIAVVNQAKVTQALAIIEERAGRPGLEMVPVAEENPY